MAAVAVNSHGMGQEEDDTAEEDSGLTQSQEETILALHNKYRCMHGAEKVKWNKDVAAGTKNFIWNSCAAIQAEELDPAKAVTAWYEECEGCKTGNCATFTDGCQKGKRSQGTHNFTAIVWKGVQEIGCALNEKKTILCCRYWSGETINKNTVNMPSFFTEQVSKRVQSGEECKGEPVDGEDDPGDDDGISRMAPRMGGGAYGAAGSPLSAAPPLPKAKGKKAKGRKGKGRKGKR